MTTFPRTKEGGFTMVEVMVAMLILAVVAGTTLGLLAPAADAFDAQPEVSDLHQRVRVSVSTLQREIASAGAGARVARGLSALGDYLAPVLPYRWGSSNPDPPGAFRSDVITVLVVPGSPAETRVVRRLAFGGPVQVVETRADCAGARSDARCGFQPGMRVLLFDPSARWDVGVAVQVDADALHLQGAAPLSSEYDLGNAAAAQLDVHSYYLKSDPARGAFQLMHYDGDQTDMPVVDHVVKLEFRYWGEAVPPQLIAGRSMSDPGPWATYGPKPPAVGDPSGTTWPDGENCTFAIIAGAHVPRLAPVAPDSSGLAPLTASMLGDGPWCPDDVSPVRYDADLLRIRRVVVSLRVQAALASLRGPASALFLYGGTGRPSRYVPDQEVTFVVAPRNLGLER